jgi:hypothetical protein
MLCHVASGKLQRLTARTDDAPLADAVVCSPDGLHVAYLRNVNGWQQVFVVSVEE